MAREEQEGVAGKHITGLFSAVGVIRICVIVIVASLLGALVVVFKLDRDLTQGYTQAIASLSQADYSLFSTIVYSALFQLFVSLSAIAAAVIFYSHKVVGPLFRFTVVFGEMSEGKVRAMTRIRKNDQLHSITDELNETKKKLCVYVDSLREKSDEIERMLDSLEQASEPEKGMIEARLEEEITALKGAADKVRLKH